VLPDYIRNVMLTAHYEIGEDGDCYGEIPGFNGVWAHGQGLEECQEALQSSLEDWLLNARRPPRPVD